MNKKVLVVDSDQFEQKVLQSQKPVIVYFYSDDCLPCLTFDSVFERVAADWEWIRFFKVFRPHNRQLADRYAVKSSPTLIFFKDGKEVCQRLTGYISYPEFREAIGKFGTKSCPPSKRTTTRCDVLIIGAGSAGLTAAIYAARSRLHTVVMDSGIPGGQVATTYHIANYPGTNGVVRGLDLMENMNKQALDFGAQIDDMQEIKEIRLDGLEKYVRTEENDYYAKSVIIATGSEPKKLPVEQESEFRGRGIHYCATCDGALYQDADVIVVGGGTSAMEEAVFLTRYARKVTVIIRSDSSRAAQASISKAMKNPQIEIVYNTIVKEVVGDNFVQGIVLENTESSEVSEMNTDGIFVYIGALPNTQLFSPWVKLSERGYIITDESMSTNLPGVFAAGDVREKEVRQIATAVGDGTIAGVMVERYITSLS